MLIDDTAAQHNLLRNSWRNVFLLGNHYTPQNTIIYLLIIAKKCSHNWTGILLSIPVIQHKQTEEAAALVLCQKGQYRYIPAYSTAHLNKTTGLTTSEKHLVQCASINTVNLNTEATINTVNNKQYLC